MVFTFQELNIGSMEHTDSPPRGKAISIDEAISETKFGVFNYTLIIVTGIISFAAASEVLCINFALPVLQCDLNLSSSEKGALGAATYFGVICSSHLWGYLADTKGRRYVIQPTLFAVFLSAICASFSQNTYVFIAFRFLSGFFVSGSFASVFAYLGEFHDTANRSRVIMASNVINSILNIVQPLLAGFVINQDWQFQVPIIELTYRPWRLYIVLSSLPGVLAASMLFFFPESPKFVLGQGKKKEAHAILQKINRVNNGKKSQLDFFEIYEEPEMIQNRQRILSNKNSRFPLWNSVWDQTAPLFRSPHLIATLLLCSIQFIVFKTSNGFFVFFGEIMNKMAALGSFIDGRMMMCDIYRMNPSNSTDVELHAQMLLTVYNTNLVYQIMNEMDVGQSGLNEKICIDKLDTSVVLNGIFVELMFCIFTVVVGLIINRIGKFTILSSILLSTGICGIGCVLTDIPLLQIFLFNMLMMSALTIGVLNAMTVELYPTSLRAMALSISLMFGRLGGAVGSTVYAFLLDNCCESAYYWAGTTVMAMVVLAFLISDIHKKNMDKN